MLTNYVLQNKSLPKILEGSWLKIQQFLVQYFEKTV